ncbi:AIR carboxylase family protein [Candidatus Woesearchaeota archaeon]|nr:AIR carboxylase family protein [Candidatus Woesearchaeota archaeon]
MPNVFVIFGSKSDEKVYSRVIDVLKQNKVEHELRICSAHRTPEEIGNILATEHSVVIAGAGLAAALPGAVAAKTIRPVIGVPCQVNYLGLDSLLSIAQMPPGIPVLAVGVNQAEIAAQNALLMLESYEIVNIIADEKTKAVEKAEAMLNQFGVKYKESLKPEPNAVNLEFVYFDEPVEKKNELCIYCPLLLEEDDKAEAAINLLKHSNHGLWVGLNRGDNAALAAIEIMNVKGQYTQKLEDFRGKWKVK